jgi:NAD(P)-dependent dehydrogenase (short-subunit alcohol dehydrogenase family)
MATRHVVVTGGARGIGEAILRTFINLGASGYSIDAIDPDDAIPGVQYLTADIGSQAEVEQVFAEIPKVDVLVNNAGIQRAGLVGIQDPADWRQVIDVNLIGAYEGIRCALPKMERGASIISIASVAAFIGLPGRSAYAAAKAGMLSMTRALAVEFAPRDITINAVCPGFIHTAFVDGAIKDGSLNLAAMMERVPLNRMGHVDEIASAVKFLASEEARYITGQSITVDGGWTIQGINQVPDWLTTQTS